jgi:transporter family protein
MKKNSWLKYSIAAFFFWGFWAFFSKINADINGAIAGMILETIGIAIIGIFVLFFMKFRLKYNHTGAAFAALSGIASVVGVLTFLYALNIGNSLLIVPLTALYPGVTVILSKFFLKEKIHRKQMIGIVLALAASVLLGI